MCDDEHHTEWAVRSDDGVTYEVEGKAQAAANREAALLRGVDEDGYSEPGSMVVERRICPWAGVVLHEPEASE